MNDRLWWYVARSSGLVAWGLLAASTLWGLALTTRPFGAGRVASRWLNDLHRFLGGLSVMFVAVHLTGVIADSFVHFGLTDVLVPMASDWHPADVAWGVVAFYVLIAVELTSLLRARLPHRLWKAVHALSFLLFVIATVHVLLAGTDADDGWALYPVLATTMAVAFLAVARAAGAGRRPQPAR